MTLSKIFKNTFLVLMASLVLTACATTKKVETGSIKCKEMFTQGQTLLNI